MAHQAKNRREDLNLHDSFRLPRSSGIEEWIPVEHDPVSDHEERLRSWFMIWTCLITPSVMAKLRERCFPLFLDYMRLYTEDLRPPPKGMLIESVSPNRAMVVSLSWSSLTSDKDGQPLLHEIQTWSLQCNLDADWCRDHALNVMLGWLYDRRKSNGNGIDPINERAFLELYSIGPRTYENPTPSIEPPPGMPPYHFPESVASYLNVIEYMANELIASSLLLMNSEASARKSFVGSILDKAASYCHEVRKHYFEERGLRFTRGRGDGLRNLQWAIQFQIQEMEFTQIAGGDYDISTVARSVKRTLNAIGLPQRPNSGPGRPVGRKDSAYTDRQRRKASTSRRTNRIDPDME